MYFSLPASGMGARLSLMDLSGRRLVTREVGSLGAGLHVVLHGTVKVTRETPHGPAALAELGPADVFGEMQQAEVAYRAARFESARVPHGVTRR